MPCCTLFFFNFLCFFYAIKQGSVLKLVNKGKKKVIHNFVKSLTTKGCAQFIKYKEVCPNKVLYFFFFLLLFRIRLYIVRCTCLVSFAAPFPFSLSLLSLSPLSLSLSISLSPLETDGIIFRHWLSSEGPQLRLPDSLPDRPVSSTNIL